MGRKFLDKEVAEFSNPVRRGLQQMQTTEGQAPEAAGHPDADLLTAFSEQSLTKREREDVLTHLALCASCREVVSLTTPELPATLQPQAEPVKPLFWKWPVLRWGAVAASVVIVVAAVSIGNLEHNRKVQQSAEVHSDAAPMAAPTTPAAAEKRIDESPNETLPPVVAGGMQRQKIRYEKVSPALAAKVTPSKDVRDDKSDVDLHAIGKVPVARQPSGGLIAMQAQSIPAQSKEEAKAAPNARISASATDQVKPEGGPTHVDSKGGIVPGTVPPAAPPPPAAKNVPGSANETVEVQGQAPAIETMKSEPMVSGGPLSRAGADKKLQDATPKSMYQVNDALRRKTRFAAATGWQVTPQGIMQRSFDNGQTWETALPGTSFRAVSSIGNEIWAGGTNGLLMHSPDSGQTWAAVSVGMHGDVTSMRFADAQHGVVKTSAGEAWETEDGGKSWKKQ